MLQTIPARSGKAAFVENRQSLKVINTRGAQVVDSWAFNRADMTEFISMKHGRASNSHIIPHVGDAMLTETPSSSNLFMKILWTKEGDRPLDAPVSTMGSHIVLHSEMDLVTALSACPQDILPINGAACQPTEAHFESIG